MLGAGSVENCPSAAGKDVGLRVFCGPVSVDDYVCAPLVFSSEGVALFAILHVGTVGLVEQVVVVWDLGSGLVEPVVAVADAAVLHAGEA